MTEINARDVIQIVVEVMMTMAMAFIVLQTLSSIDYELTSALMSFFRANTEFNGQTIVILMLSAILFFQKLNTVDVYINNVSRLIDF